MSRDMTKAQFAAALKKHGMSFSFGLGYVRIPSPNGNAATNVCRHNAGPRLRDQLAYLRREQERYHAAELAEAKFRREHVDEIELWRQLRRGEPA